MNLERTKQIATNPFYLGWSFLAAGFISTLVLRQIIENAYTTVYPLALFFAASVAICSLYLLQSNELDILPHAHINIGWRAFIISYLIILSVLLTLYHYYGFERGAGVYVTTLAIYLVTILSIIYSRDWPIPFMLVISTAIVHRATVYFTSPVAFGIDPHDHYNFAIEIAATGSLEPISVSKYYFAPFYHLLGAIGSILMDLEVQSGVMFLMMVVPIVAVSTFVIFLLLNRYWSWKIALIGPLLFLSSGHAIGGLLSLGTTELSLILFVLVVYSLIAYFHEGGKRWIFLLIFFLFALTFTHQASTFVTVLVASTLISFAAFFKNRVKRGALLISLLWITMIFDWTTTRSSAGATEGDFFTGLLGNALASFIQTGGSTENRPEHGLPPDPQITPTGMFASMTEIHVLGGAVLFGLGIVGIIWWLHEVPESSYRTVPISVGVAAAALLGMMVVGPFIGFSFFAPGRWFMYVYFLLSIFGAVGIVVIVQLISANVSPSQAISVIMLTVMLLGMVGIMGGNAYGSIDDPVFDSAPAAERLSFTDSEMHMSNFATTYGTEEGEVHTDFRFSIPIGYYQESSVSSSTITTEYDTGELRQVSNDEDTLIAVRPQMADESIYTIRHDDHWYGIYGPMPLSSEYIESYNLVYNSGGDCDNISCGIHYRSG